MIRGILVPFLFLEYNVALLLLKNFPKPVLYGENAPESLIH